MNNKINHDDIVYRYPLGLTTRPSRGGYRVAKFNDRSPEHRALLSHLRATAHPGKNRSGAEQLRPAPNLRAVDGARGLLRLGRQYDLQARDNFAKEAVLFGLIVLGAAAWPVIQSIRVMLGS